MLSHGSAFPDLTLRTATGEEVRLPTLLRGRYGVVIVYRGAWCPFHRRQLRPFAARHARLSARNITTVALSADSRATAEKTVQDLEIPFTMACEVSVPHVANALRCYTDPNMTFLQSTRFIVDPQGRILLALYSSDGICRLGPTDVMALVDRHRQSDPASTA